MAPLTTTSTCSATNARLHLALTQQGGNATRVGISGAFTLASTRRARRSPTSRTPPRVRRRRPHVDAHNDLLSRHGQRVMQKGGPSPSASASPINSFDTTTRASSAARRRTPAVSRHDRCARAGTRRCGAVGRSSCTASELPAPSRARRRCQRRPRPTRQQTTNQQTATGAAFGNGANETRLRVRTLRRRRRQLHQGHHRGVHRRAGCVVVGGDLERSRRRPRPSSSPSPARDLQHGDRRAHAGRRVRLERAERPHVPRSEHGQRRQAGDEGIRDGRRR